MAQKCFKRRKAVCAYIFNFKKIVYIQLIKITENKIVRNRNFMTNFIVYKINLIKYIGAR